MHPPPPKPGVPPTTPKQGPDPTTPYTCLAAALAPDVLMPVVGLGTWRMTGHALTDVVERALDVGYRLIDTASYYHNERDIGASLLRSRLPREALFITTKIRGADQGLERTALGLWLELSLRRLRLDYVDLLLIHWPLPMRDLYEKTWEELIRLRERGLARAIGVSNFNPWHLDRLIDATGVTPVVNQIQCNPAVQNTTMRSHNRARGVLTQAWEPLGLRSAVLLQPAVIRAAHQLGRTPAQIVLRWHLQRGHAVVPKTANVRRLAENLDVLDWELPLPLSQGLDHLNEGDAMRVDPENNLVE